MKENEQERPVERTEPASQTGKKSGADSPQERLRRNILHLLAGGYLLYLAWQLGSGFVSGIGENGWNGSMVISLIGAVVFVLTGSFLLVSCIRRMLAKQRGDPDKKED